MHLLGLSLGLLAFLVSSLQAEVVPAEANNAVTIDQAVYDDLVLYTKYSAAAYGLICPRPLGNVLVRRVSGFITGADAMVVRDDRRNEIVVVFRGTELSLRDILTDLDFKLTPLASPGLPNVEGAQVHTGFLTAYNSIAVDILQTVQQQVTSFPSYRLVVTGHSLGGAMASLGAISIHAQHSDVPMQLYTFGQPRVGNPTFASYVEQQIGTDNIFRAVHTRDGVPALPPTLFGYRHFATEYWNFKELPSPAHTLQCVGQEDPTCSASTGAFGINIPHTIYFGRLMVATPLLCL